jgi:hypothetical protein
MTKKLAKKEKAGVPAVINFSKDAGKGTEGVDKDCIAIPFLKVLQDLSPEVKKKMVKGAESGMLCNSITGELYDDTLIIPCGFKREFLRFVPRNKGGGFKGGYSPIDIELCKIKGVEKNDEGQWVIEGDDLIDTRSHYVLVQSKTGAWQAAVLSLKGTQIKKSKRFIALILGVEMIDERGKMYSPPSFSHMYKISTVEEQKGEDEWSGVVIELDGPVTDIDAYERARAFHATVAAGNVITHEPEDDVPSDGESDTKGRF